MARGILVYAEVKRSGEIAPVVSELACAANEIANGEPVYALLVGASPQAISGFDKIFFVEDLIGYNTELYAAAAIQIIKEIEPAIVLVGATNQGRDLAPHIASALGTGLTADCTGLAINENGLLEATRPTFGGQLMAVIICKTKPQMATVRPGVLKPFSGNKMPEIVYKPASEIAPKVELLEFVKSMQKTGGFEKAEIIVAGGAGMGQDGFKMLEKLADTLGATVGATRNAVHLGFAAPEKQIGQTGATVSPKLYIACGISGAVQHIVGMCNSNKIVAINIDPNAPIFENCDVGYVGDAFEVVPQLIEML